MLIIFVSGCVLNESIWPMFSSVVPLKIYPWLDTHYRGSVLLFWDVPCLEGYLSVLVWTASHTLAHGSHILFLSLMMIIFARFSNGYLSIFESTASLSIPDTRISSFINPCGPSPPYSSNPPKMVEGLNLPLTMGTLLGSLLIAVGCEPLIQGSKSLNDSLQAVGHSGLSGVPLLSAISHRHSAIQSFGDALVLGGFLQY
jgi:hypothetical protein